VLAVDLPNFVSVDQDFVFALRAVFTFWACLITRGHAVDEEYKGTPLVLPYRSGVAGGVLDYTATEVLNSPSPLLIE